MNHWLRSPPLSFLSLLFEFFFAHLKLKYYFHRVQNKGTWGRENGEVGLPWRVLQARAGEAEAWGVCSARPWQCSSLCVDFLNDKIFLLLWIHRRNSETNMPKCWLCWTEIQKLKYIKAKQTELEMMWYRVVDCWPRKSIRKQPNKPHPVVLSSGTDLYQGRGLLGSPIVCNSDLAQRLSLGYEMNCYTIRSALRIERTLDAEGGQDLWSHVVDLGKGDLAPVPEAAVGESQILGSQPAWLWHPNQMPLLSCCPNFTKQISPLKSR